MLQKLPPSRLVKTKADSWAPASPPGWAGALSKVALPTSQAEGREGRGNAESSPRGKRRDRQRQHSTTSRPARGCTDTWHRAHAFLPRTPDAPAGKLRARRTLPDAAVTQDSREEGETGKGVACVMEMLPAIAAGNTPPERVSSGSFFSGSTPPSGEWR